MNKKGKSPQQDPDQEKKNRESFERQLKYSISYVVVSLIGLWLVQQFILDGSAVKQALEGK